MSIQHTYGKRASNLNSDHIVILGFLPSAFVEVVGEFSDLHFAARPDSAFIIVAASTVKNEIRCLGLHKTVIKQVPNP